MRRLLLSSAAILCCSPAWAQNPMCPTRPAGDNSNACSSTAFVQGALPSVLVTAAPFNAACNGTGDDSVAINSAINSFPLPGVGVVLFPPNANCRVTSGINLGNGTSSAASTRQGVILRGIGDPNTAPAFPGFTATAGPKITWAGSGATGVINVNGPLQGGAIENLYIDCQSVAASIGINIISAQNFKTRDTTLVNCFRGRQSSTVAPFGSFTNTNSQHNKFYDTTVQVPAITGAIGIFSTGTTSADTDFETWIGTDCFLPTSVVTVTCFDFQATESSTIEQTHVYGGNASATSFTLDYSVNSAWPASIRFYDAEPFQSGGGTQWANTGTPGAAAKPNYIMALGETNTSTCPNIANLACFQSGRQFYNPGGNNVGTQWPAPAFVTFTPTPVCGTATFTVTNAKFYTIGKLTFLNMDFQFTALGTCTSSLTFTLPTTPADDAGFAGNDSANGTSPGCRVAAASSTATCNNGLGTNFANLPRIFFSVVYENQ